MRLSPFFPVVGSVEVSGSFIDRLTNPPKGANFKPSRYKGVVRPFLEPPRQAAGEVLRFPPLSHSHPLNYLPGWERTGFPPASLLKTSKPSKFSTTTKKG